jgi:ABC-2 type transport system ATP-binding protein
MIEVDGLTKNFGRLTAIRDVNFRIESGEIVGFLGPNGAGKTTTMRILTCFTPASGGSAKVFGMDVNTDSIKIRQKIGYLPENVPLYDWMRVSSYLEFVARAKKVPVRQRAGEIARVADAVGIQQVMGKIIRWLSKGYRQRVGLAQALLGDPPVLILDEPTIGLDPKQIREIRNLIKSFSRNRTVILSTHILPEVSQVCDRVIIINKGRIVAEDTPTNLTKSHGKFLRCRLTARAGGDQLASLINGLPHVMSVRVLTDGVPGETSVMVESSSEVDIRPDLAREMIRREIDLLELRAIQVSLEDVFIDLVTEEQDDASSSEEDERQEVAS